MTDSILPGGSRAQRILFALAAFVVVIAGMRAAQEILVPFLLSVFIAVLASPLVSYLREKGLPSWLAILLVVLLILMAGFLIGALVGTSLNDFTANIPRYSAVIRNTMQDAVGWFERRGVDFGDQAFMEYFDPGAAMRWTSRLLSGLGNVLSNALLILLTVVFMLLEATQFQTKLVSALGASEPALERYNAFFENINRYMLIKTGTSLVTGTLATVLLLILGVDYALLWGLITFLLNYIPNIGSLMASIPPILLTVVQFGPGWALVTAGGYLAINTAIGSLLEPRIMGQGLGLSTLIVFLSLLFWGWVFGPVGMVLSVPLTMTMKIALSSSEETQWLNTLLDNRIPDPPETVKDSTSES